MSDRLLRIPAILERGVSDVASVFDAFGVGIYCVDLEGRVTYVNPAGQGLLGWDADALRGREAHAVIHHTHPDGSPFRREDCPLYQALVSRTAKQDLDDVFWCRDGSPLEVASTIAPLFDDERPIGAIVVFVDVRERQRDTALLRTRAAQHSALAELGLQALGRDSLQSLLDQTAVLVSRTLHVDLVEVLELDDDARLLRLRGGAGLPAGSTSAVTAEIDLGSPGGLAILRDQPVAVENLPAEVRFRPRPWLLQCGVVSGLTVVIHSRNDAGKPIAWGVLGVHTRSRRTFGEEDIDFLHAVANTVGLAIERNAAESQLQQRNREIAELAEQVSTLAEQRQRIMADALDAEDHTREQISQLLHDEVLQSLLTARQDLANLKAVPGGLDGPAARAGEAIVSAIRELRSAVVALHPVTLQKDGLTGALRAIAELHGGRGGFDVSLSVEPQAGGFHDQLIVSLAQELLTNVAQHARAHSATVSLRVARRAIVLEIVDDGCGMDPQRQREALDHGHVGLASVAMRVEALGGRFQLNSHLGHGTTVRSVLPLDGRGARSRRPAARRLSPSEHGD